MFVNLVIGKGEAFHGLLCAYKVVTFCHLNPQVFKSFVQQKLLILLAFGTFRISVGTSNNSYNRAGSMCNYHHVISHIF